MSFDPIVQKSISEQVAQRLLTMIRSGLLKPDQQLPPERELAAMLGVGRPAVREAIRGLALLGLLRIRQGEGTFVSSLETRELLEPLEMIIDLNAGTLEALFDARLIIETGVAALAATHIGEAELAHLVRNVEDEARLLSDPAAFAAADVEFHEAIIEACDNPFLQSIAGSLYMLGKKSRSITSRIPATLERSLQDHREILDALKTRDPQKAADAMRRHLIHVRDAYRGAARNKDESVHD
ncbi:MULTISPECIES: FadR/GntR family transcriptional regulator [unclassified Herbaspirillum]|uniref:FadR/GntR family transcriptional regulator n=1 Tax=unclassified Herbaspirillum TaxID=2624150 RepID=UPI0011505149|nr:MULTISPECIES: FadR/GntR family transcriptional regulator [unclassified Herbaspirillum]MBB5391891.1 GntR family transcriptional repressor for pyruvate dehydrogenase complex [Herbaspirillum sp. SJZ102]TQK13350.1 GntR family transcriptional regulator [Herbaspirillum sp. SJZ130]TQK15354.1 GntR family transcriptional regulator [Herbaspirillum sp. SJZ106]TWC71249.1 GntR family transcriptional regulator [Herbaspirillum sp. SJZ099]